MNLADMPELTEAQVFENLLSLKLELALYLKEWVGES
jgi:hypothetical protein